MRRWLANPVHIFALLLALIPAIYLAVFMYAYRIPFPYSDTEGNNLLVVLAAIQGTLGLDDVFQNFHGHYTATSNLTSLLLYYVNRWDIYTEMALMYLTGIINTVLLVALFAAPRANRRYVYLFLLPAAALTLSPQQGVNWIATVFLAWHHNLLVILAILVLLAYTRPGWRPFSALVGLSLLAPYTVTNGLLAWGVGLVGLWLVGYRRWPFYAVYVAGALFSAFLYTQGGDYTVAVNAPPTYTTLMLTDPIYLLLATLAFMGAGVGFEHNTTSIIMGGLSLFALALNSLYLTRQGTRERIQLWWLLTLYCLGTGFLVAGTRSWDGLGAGVAERFLVIALAAWMPTIAVMLVGTMTANATRRGVDSLLLYGNIVLFTMFTAGFLYTVYSTTPTLEEGRWTVAEVADVRNAMFESTFTPIRATATPRTSVILAAHEITGHRHYDYPQLISTDDPTLVAVENPYHSAALRNLLVPEPNITYALLPPAAREMAEELHPTLHNPPNQVGYAGEVLVTDWLGEPDHFWALHHQSQSLWGDEHPIVLRDYAILDQRRADAPYNLVATHYLKTTQQISLDVRFGETIELRGWRIPSALQVPACASVTLETSWAFPDDVRDSIPIGIEFIVADGNGVGIANTRGITNIPANDWHPGVPYGDERTLTIPCDTPSGDYPLLIGVYDHNTGTALPATYPNGEPVGGLVYLTNVTVVP